MIKRNLSFTAFLFLILICLFYPIKETNGQVERVDDPRTWKYFQIFARAQDDSVFIKVQDELNVDPKLESYILVINILDPLPANQYVVIGDERSPDASRYNWEDLSEGVQKALLNWAGSNKENLNKKRITYTSVFFDVFNKIKSKEIIAPPARERDILSTTAYISPYLNIFGGDPLGIPIKKSIGFSFYTGTPYSAPLEADMVGANFHILGFQVGITSRVKEMALGSEKIDSGYSIPPQNLANYNNLYSPDLGLRFSYVLPFGNFFEIGFFTTIDTGLSLQNPEQVLNTGTGELMPNNIIKGNYTNYELRYPFRFLGSTRAKIYFSHLFSEDHIGFAAREMRLAGSQFDLRLDFMLAGKRNFQILLEPLISNIGEGFALSSFALGPSFRFSTKENNNFGLISIMLNARFKLGDFFEEKIK